MKTVTINGNNYRVFYRQECQYGINSLTLAAVWFAGRDITNSLQPETLAALLSMIGG